jgi:excisionase family DNA binding protein
MPSTKSRTPINRRERRHPELIGLQRAADYCDVSYRTVRRWVANGDLNAVRVGPRLLKVDADELAAFLQPTGGGV